MRITHIYVLIYACMCVWAFVMLHRADCHLEKDGRLGGICDATNKRKIDLTSGQQQVFSPKRIRLPARNNPQDRVTEFCKEYSPLGLKLRKTPSFINLIEMKLSQARNASDQDMKTKMDYEKLKASNFSIALLKIGTWEKQSINEGDLIAKCYFAKRKIVWEVLEGALKSKIEIQWSDIIGIRTNLHDGHYGILEIELNNPPLYFQETNPQPRKHTLWQQSTDFTEGQAPMHRRHLLVFPPGVLNKHYEKLLQCDQRLLELSKKPFPTLNTPYFGQKQYGYPDHSFNINGNGSEFMPLGHAQTFNIPVTIVHPHQAQNFKPIPIPHLGVMDSTASLVDMDHDFSGKWARGAQGEMLWNQDFNIMGQSPLEINGNPGLQYQELCPINSVDLLETVTPNSGISFPEIENNLLTDHSQVACSNINSTLLQLQGGFFGLTPQNPIVATNNPISNNQALYSYVWEEPMSQDIINLDASQNICHSWPHNG